MLKKILVLSLVTVILMGMAVFGACSAPEQTTTAPAPTASPTSAAPISLKIASAMPVTSSPAATAEWWTKEVEKRTNGRVTFETFWGGSLVKTGEELAAAQNGLVDVAVCNTPFFADKLPLINLQWPVLFSPTGQDTMLQVYAVMFKHPAMVNDVERYNTKFLWQTTVGSRDVTSNMPIRNVDDLKGKKLATSGAYYPKALVAVGAAAVSLPITERYMAQKTGVVDGQMLNMGDSYIIKMHEVCKYATWMGLGAEPVGTVVVNKDKWNKLPADIQKILEDTGKEALQWNAKFVTNSINTAEVEMTKAGVTFYTFSDAEKAKWANMLDNYPAQYAKEMDAKGLPGTELMKLFLDTCKKMGHKFPRDWEVK